MNNYKVIFTINGGSTEFVVVVSANNKTEAKRMITRQYTTHKEKAKVVRVACA